jgi:ubiquinone/menaquinone biosynthesis C-methylase UbiE
MSKNEGYFDIRDEVRDCYASIAREEGRCCEATASCGCGTISERIGYSKEALGELPAGAEMGLGCGNPISIARLQPGETVVDLGSGGGIDCFLASKEVGDAGKVIGVDMTPDMLSKARRNAAAGGYSNVEFRLGEIENLPVADSSAEVLISNCVINLSRNKLQVYREAFRVLKPGGRLAVADMVALQPLPEALKNDLTAYTGCIAGAALVDQVKGWLEEAGFQQVEVRVKQRSREFIRNPEAVAQLDDFIASADVTAAKPKN